MRRPGFSAGRPPLSNACKIRRQVLRRIDDTTVIAVCDLLAITCCAVADEDRIRDVGSCLFGHRDDRRVKRDGIFIGRTVVPRSEHFPTLRIQPCGHNTALIRLEGGKRECVQR
jgi:hypothetical protein